MTFSHLREKLKIRKKKNRRNSTIRCQVILRIKIIQK